MTYKIVLLFLFSLAAIAFAGLGVYLIVICESAKIGIGAAVSLVCAVICLLRGTDIYNDLNKSSDESRD